METKGIRRKIRFQAKKIKKAALLIMAILVIGCGGTGYSGGVIIAQAHSGRTDSQGGHHDYQNKSGLGSYHYHHGYPAHLHPNGVCPYETSEAASGQTSNSQPAAEATLNIDDYKLVFDSTFYYENNPDLQSTLGNDQQKLLEHFVLNGMAEGRKGSSNFDVMIYKNNNSDLAAAYGDDLKKYYEHFISSGYNENRVHN